MPSVMSRRASLSSVAKQKTKKDVLKEDFFFFFIVVTAEALKSLLFIKLLHSPANTMSRRSDEEVFTGDEIRLTHDMI